MNTVMMGSGMSWTLDRDDRAEFFAKRYRYHGRPALILTGKVKKDDVLAYFDGRSEKEIVALPESVEVIQTAVVS